MHSSALALCTPDNIIDIFFLGGVGGNSSLSLLDNKLRPIGQLNKHAVVMMEEEIEDNKAL